MNKHELIDKLKKQLTTPSVIKGGDFDCGHNYGVELAIIFARQLEEPEKPVVPQFVADWYEENKDYFEYNLHSLCVDSHEQKLQGELYAWLNKLSNKPIETLVKMKLFGYEVKKEKLYLASFRDTNQYLGWNEKLGKWFMSWSPFTSGVEQTQETWEGVGIWNNPAFEIKEVDE